ncbi:DUF6603 domain-containing protein [Streptosporangium roseum]|uniref:DUF6603 domain-containing protein n=1 Tax=Streptosporangium roseum TaxID=2001 RepID=UPI00332C4F5D
MTDRDFTFWLVDELRRVVEPLRVSLQNEETFAAFLERYGWRAPAAFTIDEVRLAFDILDDIAAVTQLAGTLLSPLSGSASPGDYVDLAQTLKGIVDKARTVAQQPRPTGLSQELWSSFGSDLLPGLIADYLETYRPQLLAPLLLMGVVEEEVVDAGGAADRVTYMRRSIEWSRLGRALTDPAGLARELYGWNDSNAPLRAGALVNRLHRVLGLAGLPTAVETPDSALASLYYAPSNPHLPQARQLRILLMAGADQNDTVFTYDLNILPIPPIGSPDDPPAGVVLAPDLFLGTQPDGLLWPFSLEFEGAFQQQAGIRVELEPGRTALAGGGQDTTAALALIAEAPGAQILLGTSYSHHLKVRGWRLGVQVSGPATDPEIAVEFGLRGLELVIATSEGDTFIRSLLGDEPRAKRFDATLVWSSKSGLHLRGEGGLELNVPVHLAVGPVTVDSLTFGIRTGDDGTALIAALTASGKLGPITVAISNVGLEFVLAATEQTAGAFGDLDLDLGFKPPDGLALAIDTGAIVGGGFVRFDPDAGRYAGVLTLKLGEISVEAFGLLETKLPSGYSFLVFMRAEFPPVQVGLGFALTGVGGMLAVNRRIDVDVLRQRMVSGAVGRILAPEDPVRNAPLLLSDLTPVFPPAPDVFVVGPTLRLVWAGLVRFDVGVFAELPGPSKIVVLGSARASIDNVSGGRPYLRLRLDLLGVLDTEQRLLAFDAVLIDSNLMEVLDLTGGAIFRLSWGAEPYVVMSVGGFHPAFSPAPLVAPPGLTRVAMVYGTPSDFLYLRFEGYLAITTNTRQFGASVEVIVSVGNFNIRGFLGFDALIQFVPLHFELAIEASVKVRYKKRSLGGLDLRGALSGPGPVVFRGKVCFEILWFDICFEDTFTIGSSVPPVVAPVLSAVDALTRELEDTGNLHASGDGDARVVLAPAIDSALPVLPPVGPAVWSQQRAPLGLLMQRFDGAPLARPESVTAAGAVVSGAREDWFGAGAFVELEEGDALNRRAFERLQSGVTLGAAGTLDGPSAQVTVTVVQIRIPAPPVPAPSFPMPGWVQRAAAGRLGAVERDPVTPALAVRTEKWIVRGSDGSVTEGLSQSQAHQLARAGRAGTAVAAGDTVPAMAF